jgi:hypothetical protein
MARDPLAPPAPGMNEKRTKLFSRSPKQHASFAMVQPKVNASVTSAALRQVGEDTRDAKRRRRRVAQQDRTWQQQAYDYALKVGELGYLLNLQANIVALCDFPLRRWDEEHAAWVANDPDDDTDYDPKPDNVMKAFVGPVGALDELIRRAAFNLFCAGETHLLATSSEGGDGLLWEFLSVEELFPDAEGNYIRRPSGATTEGQTGLPDDNYVARCWRSSARFSDLAESEVQRVLPICKEIVTLTEMVDAVLKSRIPAGMLFIPEELTFPSPEDGDEPVDQLADGDVDDFVEELFEHLSTANTDPGSGARLVPLVVRGPAEHGQYITLIELSRNMDNWAQELRQEALGRLASGLDAPPEIMSGRASLNHWTSAIVDNDFVVKHVQPVGRLLADFLTVAYLRPMLEAYEGMSEDDAMNWRLDFDAAPVMARADEAKSARDLAELLSDEAILIANGFTKADMVGPEALADRRLWRLVSSAPTVFAPLLNQIEGLEDVDMDDVLKILMGEGGEDPAAPVDALPDAVDVSGAPPAESVLGDGDELVDATSATATPARPEGLSLLTERLAVAADEALRAALTRAGSKVVTCAQGDDLLRDRIRSVRKDRVMSLVSDKDLERFGLNRSKLLNSAWDDLGARTRAWVRTHLDADGVDTYVADEQAAMVAHRLCERMSDLAELHLLDEFKVGSNGLRVPHSLISEVLEEMMLARSG